MDDKAALLGKLSIERQGSEAPLGRGWLWAAAASGVLAGAAGASLYFIAAAQNEVPRPPETPAQTAPLQAATPDREPAPGERVLNASGFITARRMATVSAELTGRIVELLVEEGMRVEAGAVLARLDDAIAQVDLQLARAQVTAAEAAAQSTRANLTEAQRVLDRVTSLTASEFSSEADFTRAGTDVDRLQADLARAGADLEVARLQVRRAEERLADHVVRAPFGGVVVDKNAQPGEIVAPGSAGGGFTRTGICTLVDMDSLEIEVDVNEAFIGRVTEGQPVEARLDAYPDWAIPARVVAIIPTANRDKATVKVRIALEEADPRILPDMGVNVAFLRN